MIEVTRISVVDQDGTPQVGVLVRVYDLTGTTLITQDTTTPVSGKAIVDVLLDGLLDGQLYTIRMQKTGLAFDGSLGPDSKSPQSIQVFSPPTGAPNGENSFQVRCQSFVQPVATDPRLCRVSGFFRDASGRPLPNLDLFIINKFKPAIIDGRAVLGERLDIRTDKQGYAEFDLFRNGEYEAYIQSVEAADSVNGLAFIAQLRVPDRSSVNLPDLLFPVVSEIQWNPATINLVAGTELEVFPTVLSSDYRTLTGTAGNDVQYAITDMTIATLALAGDRLTIKGLQPGSTTLTAVRRDQTIVKIPDSGIIGSPLLITVS
jgi:hypothetical protein